MGMTYSTHDDMTGHKQLALKTERKIMENLA
jgi:hypothetical protein